VNSATHFWGAWLGVSLSPAPLAATLSPSFSFLESLEQCRCRSGAAPEVVINRLL